MMTTLAIAIHPTGENPVYGEMTITVSLDDEAAGPFLVLKQESGEVRICFDEWAEVQAAVQMLMAQESMREASNAG